MKLLLVLLLVIDLLVLKKLLESKEEVSPTPTASKVVYIERPRRVVPAVAPVEEEEDLEELKERLKEEFRLKVQADIKAWVNSYVWDKEDNLVRFKLKNGIITEEEAKNSIKYKSMSDGLFSLRAV